MGGVSRVSVGRGREGGVLSLMSVALVVALTRIPPGFPFERHMHVEAVLVCVCVWVCVWSKSSRGRNRKRKGFKRCVEQEKKAWCTFKEKGVREDRSKGKGQRSRRPLKVQQEGHAAINHGGQLFRRRRERRRIQVRGGEVEQLLQFHLRNRLRI